MPNPILSKLWVRHGSYRAPTKTEPLGPVKAVVSPTTAFAGCFWSHRGQPHLGPHCLVPCELGQQTSLFQQGSAGSYQTVQ